MNKDSKKSLVDFKGQAMPTNKQKTVKGGNVNPNPTTDWIIMDDILDT